MSVRLKSELVMAMEVRGMSNSAYREGLSCVLEKTKK